MFSVGFVEKVKYEQSLERSEEFIQVGRIFQAVKKTEASSQGGSENSKESSVAEVKWGEEEIAGDQRPNRSGVCRSQKSFESPRKILSFSLSKIG